MRCLVLFLVIVAVSCNNENDELLVDTNAGTVQGEFVTSENGRVFRSFRSIPYAEPPIGDLRFERSVPVKRWDGIRNAISEPSACTQVLIGQTKAIGNEDCLYLTVHSPITNSTKGLNPVVVYIHGGEYRRGSANSNKPDYFIERGIVFISINYRLGILGFFTTGDTVVPGNNGLKDQNLALKWVKANIKKFNGNPNKITIMGQSSGAAAARLHVISPSSKGLFRRVIAQGNNELCTMPANSLQYVDNLGKRLSEKLNCPTNSSFEQLACLRSKTNAELSEMENTFDEVQRHMYGFVPLIEPDHPNAFIKDYPWNYVRNGESSQVSWLNAVTLNEGALRIITYTANPDMLTDFDQHFEKLLPNNDLFTIQEHCIASVAEEVRNYYIGNASLPQANTQKFIDLISDIRVLTCEEISIQTHLDYSDAPVYNLLFAYDGYASYADQKTPNFTYKPVEYDNEFYTFPPTGFYENFTKTEADKKMTTIYTDFLSNFVRYGNPTPAKSQVKWQPISIAHRNEYLLVNGPDDIKMQAGMFKERMNFWRRLCNEHDCLIKYNY